MKIFASPGSWIEGDAERQLSQTAALPGMQTVAGMPDLTPSKGCAVGTAALAHGHVYPHLVGNDIGCGYRLLATTLKASTKPTKLADYLVGLDAPWHAQPGDHWLANFELDPSAASHGLGTVGAGNHFAELQRLEEPDSMPGYGLDPNYLVLLVHSGSRGLGESLYRETVAECGAAGLADGTDAAQRYMTAHDTAMRWAACNRALIAERMLAALGGEGTLLVDLPHNFIERVPGGYLHRKGAAPADRGLSPLPGSRDAASYVLRPTLPAPPDALASLPHGAGRKVSRANMHGRVQETAKQMMQTKSGGIVVCGDDSLLIEEHPRAYKPIERVLQDLVAHELAVPVARFRPVVTYKSARKSERTAQATVEKKDDWRSERRRQTRKP